MRPSIMFPDTESGARRGSDASLSSCSTTSSSSSSSLSPPFANPISIPLKSLISPPSTTTTEYFSLSPATLPPAPYNSPASNSACAFPSWPSGPLLTSSTSTTTSPTSCYFHNASSWKPTSSHISDEDLLDLEELELRGDMRVVTGLPEMEISWSMTRQPPVVVRAPERKQKKKGRRRRSSPLKKEKWVGKMSPIVEGEE